MLLLLWWLMQYRVRYLLLFIFPLSNSIVLPSPCTCLVLVPVTVLPRHTYILWQLNSPTSSSSQAVSTFFFLALVQQSKLTGPPRHRCKPCTCFFLFEFTAIELFLSAFNNLRLLLTRSLAMPADEWTRRMWPFSHTIAWTSLKLFTASHLYYRQVIH